ncbi:MULTISPECIES: 4'-phosphopantetheinyl transferase superfamily protein [Streptomyces]|uniref:4'-phosphopantetheinyl transferase superfamily protein n=1 Tax=Streptomyces lycii TaxID=2654337 RepID=A0ABQ7FCI4_9ACTN|nr:MULTISPECIES: 4'-phosphopantetheinyl transferase superfamily protein [Streptomyces]KAF4406794.1 4'-phosphopantetheinyl transferase superfamily protein [Streptomyces lycii]PGH49868.1 4-phosphopantetheinyl transferase [Streptomyces sp. Ru87]
MHALAARHRVTVVVTPTSGLGDRASRDRVLAAAARVTGAGPGRLRIGHEPGGRPVLSGLGPGVHVSLSHGRGFAALALTGLGPLGVDVEVERPVHARRMAERWFTAAESRWLRERPEEERRAAFFWLWTHKEAMGKAYGTGLDDGGLLRPAPLPEGRPPRGAGRPPLLLPAPADGELSVAAPFVRPGVALAVAVLGRHARSAPVDVRLCLPEAAGPPP